MRVIRFFAVILISVFLAACAQTKTVTVTEYRDRVVTDTVEKLRVDSVYVSRWIKQKGDTIILHDTIFKYRVLHDTETVKEYVHDSIPYQVEVEVTKEVRKRNGYDRFTSWGFWILALLLCARIAWWAFKTFYLRR